jgi:hypothetical protein
MKNLVTFFTAAFIAILCMPGRPQAADQGALAALLEEKTRAIAKLQGEHLAELSVMASNPTVHDYFDAAPAKRPGKLPAVKAALAGRQMGSELCLIDSRGREHLRAVRGRLASEKELAVDEVDAPFFAPGMALSQDSRYISEPYLSPDVEEWVVGFVIPVVPGQLVLHFEHPISEYQQVLTGDATSRRFALAIDRAGYVVADSRHAPNIRKIAGKDEAPGYFANIFKGPESLPVGVTRVIAAGAIKPGMVSMGGQNYLMDGRKLDGITLLVFEPADGRRE